MRTAELYRVTPGDLGVTAIRVPEGTLDEARRFTRDYLKRRFEEHRGLDKLRPHHVRLMDSVSGEVEDYLALPGGTTSGIVIERIVR